MKKKGDEQTRMVLLAESGVACGPFRSPKVAKARWGFVEACDQAGAGVAQHTYGGVCTAPAVG